MKQLVSIGIVLSRTNYGEADRIVTVLTPNYGKLRLMARGVRKIKSKLAGGIELFSVSDITFIEGNGDIGTLISSRIRSHYGNITKNLERVNLGYELLKQLNRATEDHPEEDYFYLLESAFEALNAEAYQIDIIGLWFQAQLLRLAGHTPNLKTTVNDEALLLDQTYDFDMENMAFLENKTGHFSATHIKTLRLLFNTNSPSKLQQVGGLKQPATEIKPLLVAILTSYIRV